MLSLFMYRVLKSKIFPNLLHIKINNLICGIFYAVQSQYKCQINIKVAAIKSTGQEMKVCKKLSKEEFITIFEDQRKLTEKDKIVNENQYKGDSL